MILLLHAQPFYFKNYQVDNGLSSNTITCIAQDQKGFMWFGTPNGLNRFDGRSFRVFQSSLSDSTSIGSNSILSLYEDETAQLWVGTYKGVYLYNPVQETFKPLKGFPQVEIQKIKGDGANNIWMIARGKLYNYNLLTNSVKNYGLQNEETTAICLAQKGDLWASSNNGVLRKFNRLNRSFTHYTIPLSAGEVPDRIQRLYAIGDTALLIGTLKTLILFDVRSGKVKQHFENIISDAAFQVRDIVQQNPNEFWIGTETGLYIVDLQTQKSKTIKKQDGNPYTLTDNVIRAICKDREGGTWIGTFFGGINYFSKQYNAFQKYFPKAGSNSLSGNAAHSISSDQNGAIWVGTEDAGLNKLNPQTGQITHYQSIARGGRLAYHNLHGLVANGNELWVGTYQHGLDVLNINTGKVIRHYSAGPGANDLKNDFIVTLYKTRAGEILVGTWKGLFRYNRKNDNFSPIPFVTSQVQSIYEEAAGTLWVGSHGNGIYYYNALTNDSGILQHQPGNANSLGNDYVNSVFEDSNNRLWICTEGGLFSYDKRLRTFGQPVNENRLLNSQVFRVEEDDKHLLWISSSRGLFQYDPLTHKSNVYTTVNGLPTNQFNYNSSYKSADGKLYFGTVKGLVQFDPGSFTINKYVPPVYITGLQINNREVISGIGSSPLTRSITYTSQLTLPHNQSNLSFDVAALSYVMPEQNNYAYKMEGIDKEWTVLKQGRRIYYTKLPPGNYTFRLKGSNESNVWNPKERILRITITPPIWASTGAYLLYGLLFLGITMLLLRYYHFALNEKNLRMLKMVEIEKERELHQAKIEFFTNITHEIRTPLTLIKLPLEKMLKQGNNVADVTENLKMMQRNTNRLIDLTNQLLDFRKAETAGFSLSFTKTDINELLTDILVDYRAMAEQQNLQFKVDMPRMSLQAYVDVEAFRKIVTNLLSNAFKYADRTITLKLLPFSSIDDVFTIEVANDGYLIPGELHTKIFEPFYRVKETEKMAGAGIGLSLARSLAQLHSGNLELKPSQQGLNIFWLSLPIHQQHRSNVDEHLPYNEQNVNNNALVETTAESKPVVLVVEDSKEILGFIKTELQHNYSILKAYNGAEALKVLQKEAVDLIVSDVMMPVMDGFELCKKIKTDFQFSHIPIILLTAKNTLQSKIEGLELGADAYIEKPFSYEHLQAQVANLLQNRKTIKEHFAHSPHSHLSGISYSKVDSTFLENLQKVIDTNITNIELDVEQLSKLMNISRPTLYRKIKAMSNLTPSELISLSRLKKAAQLLATNRYKVSEVASMIGYSSQSNLSRDFHKQFGITPSNYMNS